MVGSTCYATATNSTTTSSWNPYGNLASYGTCCEQPERYWISQSLLKHYSEIKNVAREALETKLLPDLVHLTLGYLELTPRPMRVPRPVPLLPFAPLDDRSETFGDYSQDLVVLPMVVVG